MWDLYNTVQHRSSKICFAPRLVMRVLVITNFTSKPNSGQSCVLGKSEIAGTNTALAYKFQRSKNVSSLLTRKKINIVGSPRDREVARFRISKPWSSHSSRQPQKALLAHFTLVYVCTKVAYNPIHFICIPLISHISTCFIFFTCFVSCESF